MLAGVSLAVAEWCTTITFHRPRWIPPGGVSSAVFSPAATGGGAGLGAGASGRDGAGVATGGGG